MEMFADLFGQIKQALGRVLPFLLMMLVISGLAMLTVTMLLPALQTNTELNARMDAARARWIQQEEALQSADPEGDLQTEIIALLDDITVAAQDYLSPAEADMMLDRLYSYAAQVRVRIEQLIAVEDQPVEANAVYEKKMFRLRVVGEVLHLIHYVIRIRETLLPTVIISDVAISPGQGGEALLTLTFSLLQSTHAPGNMDVRVAAYSAPDINPPPGDHLVVNLPTPTMDPNHGVPVPTPLPMVETPDCSGIDSYLSIGDMAVVQLQTETVVNLLDDVRTANTEVEVLYALPNNAMLQVLDGPVCGDWQGQAVNYWLVEYYGLRGWVGEASDVRRWLCPQTHPECA